MKVSLLKISRNKLVVNRLELSEIADVIRNNPDASMVSELRLNYQFFKFRKFLTCQFYIDKVQRND